jgi:glycosyltransferase involved in cell wall biosynthesis
VQEIREKQISAGSVDAGAGTRAPTRGQKGKILYAIGSFDLGGTEHHLCQILPLLRDRGWDVSLYCVRRRGSLAPRLTAAGIEVIAPPLESALPEAARLPASATKLAALLLGRRPDIVHLFLPEAYLVGGPLSFLTRRMVRVASRRNLNRYQAKRPMLAKLEHALHPHMHAVLGNSRAIIDELVAEGCPPDRTGLIYNGIDLAPYAVLPDKAQARAALGLGPDDFVAVIVANLIPYKGHRDLIEALAKIRHELPSPWHLLCVGRDDGIGDGLVALARNCGIESNIRFLGERANVINLLAASDVGILCSHEEGFSNVILEYMAVGLPVVATDVGGNAEAVVDGNTGLVVPPRDPDALGAAILKVARDPASAASMGAAGRRRVDGVFALEACVAQYDALYLALLAATA